MWKSMTSSLVGFSYAIRSISQTVRLKAVIYLIEQGDLSREQLNALDRFKDELINS